MLGIVVLLAVLVVVLLVLGVQLAGRRLGHQQGENGHQDGVQHLLLQDGLENNNNFINMARITIFYYFFFKCTKCFTFETEEQQ